MNKLCECCCGKEVTNEKNRFINGHNRPFKGKKLSPEHRLKLSIVQTGRTNSPETRLKLSLNHRGGCKTSMLGKKHTPQSKLKMSLSAIKHIQSHKFDNKIVRPCIGKNETLIIDQLCRNTNIKLLRNDYNLSTQCGKFPDAFCEKYNIVIEILESHHFKSDGKLSDNDQNRELIISWKLGCMIYYISEQEFLKHPEKEIKRFKDFLLLLDQGIN